ncbi:MAG TPA: hypothetical protein VL221_12930 [Bacteroidota bacterium]|nr:hypothetical protein [Bacteroidota bacterium]
MLNRRMVDIYGYAAIALMVAMLTLVAAKLVPQRLYMPFFYITAALFVVRVALRLLLARQDARRAAEKNPEE